MESSPLESLPPVRAVRRASSESLRRLNGVTGKQKIRKHSWMFDPAYKDLDPPARTTSSRWSQTCKFEGRPCVQVDTGPSTQANA